MYMLSFIEKEIAIETSQNYFAGTAGKLLFKILSNYLANTSELNSELKDLDDAIFSDEAKLKEYSKTIISYMVDVEHEVASTRTYTTGELSKFFGVSITSINNWIKEKRLIGLKEKEKNKQSRISENTLWKSPNGELIPIKEIVEMYNKQNVRTVSKQEEIDILMAEIKFFEDKYDGNYKETLGIKKDRNNEEEIDRVEWSYLLRRIKEYNV